MPSVCHVPDRSGPSVGDPAGRVAGVPARIPGDVAAGAPRAWPVWVPPQVRSYLAHTEGGASIRAIARASGCHASTILRQVRRTEGRRDDPLIDRGLSRLGRWAAAQKSVAPDPAFGGRTAMSSHPDMRTMPDDDALAAEARRILGRLAEPGATLAVARDMEKAVVVRDAADGRTLRTGVVDRTVAEALALKDWIVCAEDGRVARYRITAAGRAALKRLAAEAAGDPDAFAGQHRDWDEREVGDGDDRRRVRVNAAESPLTLLARRKDTDGRPFLTPAMVAAGERLREDFELAQMGPRVTQNWDRFLTGGDRGGFTGRGPVSGPDAARGRVTRALADLGPGLGDVALRTCCFLEGMETVERRLGWSARSGKVVLRIALERLAKHYDSTEGGWSPLIG